MPDAPQPTTASTAADVSAAANVSASVAPAATGNAPSSSPPPTVVTVSAAAAVAAAGPTVPGLRIRAAIPEDAALLHRLVHELAEYEHLEHEAVCTPTAFTRDFFDSATTATPTAATAAAPRVFALLAFIEEEPAGFAVWYPTYSTFAGRFGAFLEDLYVCPAFRRRGVARALLVAFEDAAKSAGCSRLEWRALAWNTPALDFYKSIGAHTLPDWLTLRKELAE
jgi:GNAT superfamily N-acetyltransferase